MARSITPVPAAGPSLERAAGMKVAIMCDETGWHTTRLKKAFRARGVDARCVDLADCGFDTTVSWHGIVIPGFARALPDAVFVRGIAGGSFEQVTLRLGVLHALREAGVPVYNDARAIERSVDKAMTSFLLKMHRVPTPAAWAFESPAAARRVTLREIAKGERLVIKPLFGSQGKGLARIDSAELPDLKAYDDVAYLQRFVDLPPPGFDWRVLVIGGRAVAAMRRSGGNGWVHNVAQGARCAAAPLDPALCDVAVRATRAIGLDYAGVDLMPCLDGLQPALVIEVNGVAAWRGLQSVTPVDVAAALADDLLAKTLAARERAQAEAAASSANGA